MYSCRLSFSVLTTLPIIWCAAQLPTTAQIIPDRTLSSESSVVTPNQNIRGINSDRIDGGAVRGSNLFHSFQEFNVNVGRGAYFSNPDNIINILTRVTGGNISEILGTLGVLGNANLFLMNPNGIVFGPNARLDVGGSFFATTADGILFENGIEFAASNPEAPPLLTINMPLGLNIRENPGTIVNQSTAVDSEENLVGLQVQPRRTLGFVGGDIRIEAGILTAPQGRIELGSVEGNSLVSLTPIDKGYALGYEDAQNFRDISLSQSALVDVRGEGGGDIQIQGQRVTLTESSVIEASTQGSEPGGILSIQASESVEVFGSNILANVDPGAIGAGGNLIIDTQRLVVQDGLISASTFGNGDAGNLTITATDMELVDGNLAAFAGAEATGDGGNITINTQNLSVRDGAQIGAATFGNGDGGNLTVTATNVELVGAGSILGASVQPEATGNAGTLTLNTQNLSVRDGAQIGAATFGNGDGGNLTVTATNVEVVGTSADGQSSSLLGASVQPEAIGNGGTLTLNTQNLSIRDGAQIGADTFGNGDGGNLTITATDVELVGRNSLLRASVEQGAIGNGGTLTLNTQRLSVRDGAQIGADTFGNGNAGDLTITATDIELVGTYADGQVSSLLGASVQPEAIGNGGTLTLNIQNLSVRDGAQILTSTFGNGDAGDLTITATDIELVNGDLGALVAPSATGNSGTLTIDTQNLSVRDGSQISTSTFGNGDGGDLNVTSTNVELIGTTTDGQFSSLLGASALSTSTGQGGTLTINTENLTVRDGARIDVSSEGIKRAGDLIINAPTILLDNDASLNAETTAGEGNIILNTEDLRLRNNSQITTNATGVATGGNIEINTDTLIAIEDSDISANAQAAFGGQVIIRANAIFGTEFRQQPTGASDITATSELGPDFSGTVDLDSEIDPAQGLVELPQTIVDPNDLIAQDPCKLGADSEFFITGRGGLVPDPTEELTIIEGLVEWESFLVEPITPQANSSPRRQQRSRKRDNNRENTPLDSRTIVPARGWIRNSDGDIILVGYDPTKTGVQRQPKNPYSCQS